MQPATAADGRRFGKYTLVAKLATGGMAEIFLARLHGDGGFEKLVCIKRILPHLAKDPQFVAMFLDEARVAARISHPNVCQVFELGEWQKQYYIAMEYLEGVPLSVFRRKDFYPAPPDPRLVAGFGVQACEGLHHAHQLKRPDGELLGVVHRDISPQNLFATTDGVVKVLDFGIAKVQDATVRTSTGAVKGTYAYMAPEQLRNETLDRRSDVWAIGVVLWETLAQTHLFKRDTEFLTFEAITKLPIPDICSVRPDVPPLLGDTIARALSRDPEERFPSARALGEALGQAVGPLGGPMTPAGISDEVGHSFEAALAEQRMLLRIAREGGQFDLESSSPLVGHGTKMSTTPVSNIQRRAQEAAQEVANFVAATQAIESLDEEHSDGRPHKRFGTDGAFTPAPSRGERRSRSYEVEDGVDPELEHEIDDQPPRRSSSMPVQRRSSPMGAQPERRSSPMGAQPERRSSPMDAQPERRSSAMAAQSERRSSPMAAQRRSSPYAVAPQEWRYDETEPPYDEAPRRMTMPHAPVKPSRLPWIIAVISIAAAATTGVMLYIKLSADKQPAAAPEDTAAPAIVMNAAPAAPDPATAPATVPADAAVTVVATETKSKDVEVAASGTEVTPPPPPSRPLPPPPPKKKKVIPKEEQQVQPPPPPPPVEIKPAGGPPGMITIDSAPVYAVIYVDGKKLGETPLVNIKLAPGKHAVRAVSPSGATKNLSITIESGKTAPPRKISW